MTEKSVLRRAREGMDISGRRGCRREREKRSRLMGNNSRWKEETNEVIDRLQYTSVMITMVR